ncbi:hypothetical protein [Luteipulveratus halotolerans]|uniref:hypothetical protein n=1 Tax=Luteipulveratus halotolerans TaxID=1631356 RepID=UPI0018D0D35B|nr:hypothetical protein [Luteipulveratus halotolerans]
MAEVEAHHGEDLIVLANVAHAARMSVPRMAVALADLDGVAFVPLAVPPTRAVAVAGMAYELLATVPIDVVAAVIPRLDGLCRTTAHLSSVARLTTPNPGVVRHMTSWWPSTTYTVDWDAQRVRSGRHRPEGNLERTVRSLRGHGARWGDGPATIDLADDPNLVRPFWESSHVMELTSLPVRVPQEVLAPPREGPARCANCDRAGASSVCLFCGVLRPSLPTGKVPVS